MTCKGCGNRIPEKYLRLEAFKCPFCGRLYRRTSPQHARNSISHTYNQQIKYNNASATTPTSRPQMKNLLSYKNSVLCGLGVLLGFSLALAGILSSFVPFTSVGLILFGGCMCVYAQNYKKKIRIIQEALKHRHNLQTALGMYQFCIEHNCGAGAPIRSIRNFFLIESILRPDEMVHMCFTGLI